MPRRSSNNLRNDTSQEIGSRRSSQVSMHEESTTNPNPFYQKKISRVVAT